MALRNWRLMFAMVETVAMMVFELVRCEVGKDGMGHWCCYCLLCHCHLPMADSNDDEGPGASRSHQRSSYERSGEDVSMGRCYVVCRKIIRNTVVNNGPWTQGDCITY